MKFLIAPVLLVTSLAMAQTPVTVKPSPAADALVKAAQDLQSGQKSFDIALSQARIAADASQKSLQADIQRSNTELLAELKADKKYAAKLAAIDTMQKELNAVVDKANQKFQQEAGPIQNEMNKDKALIDGLTPVVRKENDLPATATFDPVTQKWTEAKATNNPVEMKK